VKGVNDAHSQPTYTHVRHWCINRKTKLISAWEHTTDVDPLGSQGPKTE